jgi:hypothetical protein
MGNVTIKKQEAEKEFVFAPLTAEVGDDTFTLTWEKPVGRFDLRKNGELLVSDVRSHACIETAREKGVVFQLHEKKGTA